MKKNQLFVLPGSQGYEDSLRIAGGKGSGWSAEGGHVKGSQGGAGASKAAEAASGKARVSDTQKNNAEARDAHILAARAHHAEGNSKASKEHLERAQYHENRTVKGKGSQASDVGPRKISLKTTTHAEAVARYEK